MTTKETILARLGEIEFHDLPVEQFSFTAKDNYSCFSIDYCDYNEAANDYDRWTIRFVGLVSVSADQLAFGDKCDFEVFRFRYQWEELFEGEITFLLGVGQPSYTVAFKCRSVEMEPATSAS